MYILMKNWKVNANVILEKEQWQWVIRGNDDLPVLSRSLLIA